MIKILERAYEKAIALPADRQDEVGEILLNLVEQDESDLRLASEQEAEVGKGLIAAAKEARAIARGEADPATYRIHVPPEIDVKALRRKLKLSQVVSTFHPSDLARQRLDSSPVACRSPPALRRSRFS
jgi:hypothetical protein